MTLGTRSSSPSDRSAPGHAGSSSERAAAIEQRAPRERVAVAAQPRTRDPDQPVAGAHAARQHARAFDDADREPDEVELARRHEVGMLRDLAAEQRAAGHDTAVGDAGHDLFDLLGDEMTDRHVVEEEQRLRALDRDVVGRHRDEVDPDRVAPPGQARDHRLRADSVGRRHEHRVVVALPVDREQPAEPADVAHDLGPERAANVRLDQLDRLLARGDVDARVAIRERRAVALGHRRRPDRLRRTRRWGAAARCRPPARASCRNPVRGRDIRP